jgi:hypothetical protein
MGIKCSSELAYRTDLLLALGYTEDVLPLLKTFRLTLSAFIDIASLALRVRLFAEISCSTHYVKEDEICM